MAKVINVTFPPGTEPLYRKIVQSKAPGVPLTVHVRTLLYIPFSTPKKSIK